MSKIIRAFYNLSSNISKINNYGYKKIDRRELCGINKILKSFYNNNNDIDWDKYMLIRNNTYYESNMFIYNNISLSTVNIPRNTNFHFTNNGNSSFIVLSGGINKYYINNNFEMYNTYNVGNVGNIYHNEKYNIETFSDDTLLIKISIYNSIEDCIKGSRNININSTEI
jgi:hypothetical protein